MASEILCPAVDHNIGSESNRSLKVRCQKGIVHYEELSVFMGDLCHCLYVRYGEKRICRTFYKNCFDIFVNRILDLLQIGSIHYFISDPEIAEYIFKDPKSPAINIVRDHQLISRFEKGQNCVYGCQPGGKCKTVFPMLKFCYEPFESVSCRIPGPGILPSSCHSQAVLFVSRRLIDRNIDCSRSHVSVDPTVY